MLVPPYAASTGVSVFCYFCCLVVLSGTLLIVSLSSRFLFLCVALFLTAWTSRPRARRLRKEVVAREIRVDLKGLEG